MSARGEHGAHLQVHARRAPTPRRAPLLAAALATSLALLAGCVAESGAAVSQERRLDLVWLTDGGPPIEGRIASEDARSLEVEVAGGRVRVSRERIERVERGAGAVMNEAGPAATRGHATPGNPPPTPTAAGAPSPTTPGAAPAAVTATAVTASAAETRIRLLAEEVCALARSGRTTACESATSALVAEIRRHLYDGEGASEASRLPAKNAARDALASLPPPALAFALEDAVGLPLDVVAPALESALALSRPPPSPAIRPDPAPALALRRAVAEALCHAVRDEDAPLDPRAPALLRELLAEPEGRVRLLVLEHLDGCAKPGIPLVLVDLFEGDPSPEVRARARAALLRISRGADFGDDAAMWRAHFLSHGAAPR